MHRSTIARSSTGFDSISGFSGSYVALHKRLDRCQVLRRSCPDMDMSWLSSLIFRSTENAIANVFAPKNQTAIVRGERPKNIEVWRTAQGRLRAIYVLPSVDKLLKLKAITLMPNPAIYPLLTYEIFGIPAATKATTRRKGDHYNFFMESKFVDRNVAIIRTGHSLDLYIAGQRATTLQLPSDHVVISWVQGCGVTMCINGKHHHVNQDVQSAIAAIEYIRNPVGPEISAKGLEYKRPTGAKDPVPTKAYLQYTEGRDFNVYAQAMTDIQCKTLYMLHVAHPQPYDPLLSVDDLEAAEIKAEVTASEAQAAAVASRNAKDADEALRALKAGHSKKGKIVPNRTPADSDNDDVGGSVVFDVANAVGDIGSILSVVLH